MRDVLILFVHMPSASERMAVIAKTAIVEQCCNSFESPKVSTPDLPPSRTEDGRGILGEWFRSIVQQRMREGNKGYRFDFRHAEDSQVRLPLLESI
jgi:hypothetical protein